MKTARSATGLLASLRRCQRGIAAVEFALILPILILLLLGTTELTRALTYDRKISQIASTVADLVSQASALSSGEVTDIFSASEAILEPYPSTTLGIVIASVEFDADGNPTVSWSRAHQATPWTANAVPPIEIPVAIRIPDTSTIVAVSSYTYEPIFTAVITENIELGETFLLRPRLVDTIPEPT